MKWRIFLAAVFLILFGVVLYVLDAEAKKEQSIEEGVTSVTDNVVMDWLTAFTSRDFTACDALVYDQDVRFFAPMVLTHSRDSSYYEKTLNAAISCISDIHIIDKTDQDYKVLVKLLKYKPITKLELSGVEALRSDYLSGSMIDNDFNSELQRIYFDTFSSQCFQLSEESAEFVAILSVNEVEDVKYVLGTSEFVDFILTESNISANLGVFERDIKSSADALLKAGW